jgi:hypothetical protein
MTSTPVTILLLRSNLESDRPNVSILQYGELALCSSSGDPGFYFLDTNNDIRKIGPAGYGVTAPNALYIGASGNSVGEAWTDSTVHNYYKVWNGTDWIKISAGFSDTATLSSGAILASGALLASGAYLASGAIQASGAILSSGALLASGAYLASGAIQASGAILSSGALLASGAIQASGAILASGSITSETATLASGAILASGAVASTSSDTAQLASGAVLASGAIFSDAATLASGAILASGSIFSDTATIASGAVYASGASSIATVIASGLPDPVTIESGVAYLQLESSGTYPSGLYIRAGSDWYFI